MVNHIGYGVRSVCLGLYGCGMIWKNHHFIVVILLKCINQNGKYLTPSQWFDNCGDFEDGYANVKLNNEWYLIDTEGNLYDEDNNFIRNLRESVSERKMDMIIESTLRKYLRK